jgi:hypothetical protein
MAIAVIIIGMIFVALIIRLIAGGMDYDRVDAYITERGGRVIEKHWNPFGTGWFGEKNARIYNVRYQDAAGNIHEATCKTSMLGGVYFTQDEIVSKVSRPDASSREAQLERENEQLRRQLEDLKRNDQE